MDGGKIRWMIRSDFERVIQIEHLSFDSRWDISDLIMFHRQKNCVGIVIESDGIVIGYLCYELHVKMISVLNFAVVPCKRLRGYGTAMIQWLIEKLEQGVRKEIVLELRETNLIAQLFFKQMGFKCVSILDNYFNEINEDGYLFSYGSPEENQEKYSTKNRITEFFNGRET